MKVTNKHVNEKANTYPKDARITEKLDILTDEQKHKHSVPKLTGYSKNSAQRQMCTVNIHIKQERY